MNDSESGIIYIATNLDTGKQYVGQTKNFKLRLRDHLSNRRNTYFGNSLLNHGINAFNFVQLPYPKDMLSYWEQFWITKLNTMYPNGYNMTTGGEGGYKRCEETLKRMSEAQKGRECTEETRRKISQSVTGEKNGHFGKHHSAETKAIIREKRKNQIFSDETRKKLSAKKYSLETRKKMSEWQSGGKSHRIGKSHSDEARALISAAAKLRVGEKSPRFGKHLTDETKRKISEAHKRNHLNRE